MHTAKMLNGTLVRATETQLQEAVFSSLFQVLTEMLSVYRKSCVWEVFKSILRTSFYE